MVDVDGCSLLLSSSLLRSTCSGPVTDESVVINLDDVVVFVVGSASIVIIMTDDSQQHTVTVMYICILPSKPSWTKLNLEWTTQLIDVSSLSICCLGMSLYNYYILIEIMTSNDSPLPRLCYNDDVLAQ